MQINVKLAAGLLLTALAGAAQAEGNYSNMKMYFILYAMVALAVMAGQAIYILSLAGATATRKFMWVLALAVIDAVAVFALYWLTLETHVIDLEGPFGYILVVIPGFIYISIIKNHLVNKAQHV